MYLPIKKGEENNEGKIFRKEKKAREAKFFGVFFEKTFFSILSFHSTRKNIPLSFFMIHTTTAELSLSQMVDFIVSVYHAPLRNNLHFIENETLQLALEYGKRYPELLKIKDLFLQFRLEVIHHINQEEEEFFPVLKQIEDCALGIRDFSDCDLQKFEKVIHKLELEHEHFDTYVRDLVEVFRQSELRYHDVFTYDHFHNYYSLLENETMRHTEMENIKLHPLAKKLFKTVCNLF